jgi:hypothetical protein
MVLRGNHLRDVEMSRWRGTSFDAEAVVVQFGRAAVLDATFLRDFLNVAARLRARQANRSTAPCCARSGRSIASLSGTAPLSLGVIEPISGVR